MNINKFHYVMTHDEFGDKGLSNNYYFLFVLVMAYILIMTVGSIGLLTMFI